MRRPVIVLVAAWLLATTIWSCGGRTTIYRRKITGTCSGACQLYLNCKGIRSAKSMKSCVRDCREMFSGAEGLKAFESMARCEDVISFVEGESGRGPGSTP